MMDSWLRTRSWILFLPFVALPWPQAGAEETLDFPMDPNISYSVTDRNRYACLATGARTRAVYVEYTVKVGEAPCVVVYESASPKGASREVLWRAQADVQFCEMHARELVDRLRDGEWKCGLFRDVLGSAE